jgi:hypothetical protein
MTTDVRTLLHGAAEAPERAPDIDGAIRSARDRRRRRRGLSALAAVVVLALVGGALVLGGGGGADGARVAIGQTSSVPDGWKSVSGPGISMAIPPDWDSYDFGQAGGQRAALSVGTGPLPSNGVPAACVQSSSEGADLVFPTTPGVWVAIWESADPASTQLPLPAGDVLSVQPRPATFARFAMTGGTCAHVGEDPGSGLAGAFTEFAFVDSGRAFGVKVVAASVAKDVTIPEEGKPKLDALKGQIDALTAQLAGAGTSADPRERQLQALQSQYDGLYDQYAREEWASPLKYAMDVLDTLQVDPPDAETSTTASTTTTMPVVTAPKITRLPATTAPAFTPTTADEREIAELVVRWLHYQTDDEIRASIVGADSILDLMHEGMRQYQSNLPDGYTGQIESMHLTDATHAEFVFTLLLHGSPLYAHQNGGAVKVDGKWMITRESECSLLALGQLICPAR